MTEIERIMEEQGALAVQLSEALNVLRSGIAYGVHWYTCSVLTGGPDYKGPCDERCLKTRGILALTIPRAMEIANLRERHVEASRRIYGHLEPGEEGEAHLEYQRIDAELRELERNRNAN